MGALSYYMRPSTATEPGNDGVLPGRWRPVDTENGSGYGIWVPSQNTRPMIVQLKLSNIIKYLKSIKLLRNAAVCRFARITIFTEIGE